MTSTDYFKMRVSQGLCGACGKPNDREDKTTCSECNSKRAKEIIEDRKWYLEHKICPRCHKNTLMGSERTCLECKAYATNQIMIKREDNKDKYNAYMRDYQKEQTKKRREQGICTRCGKRKPDSTHVMCAVCRGKNQTGMNRTDNGKERVKKGLCYWCGEPVKPGYKICQKHYDMNIQKLNNEKTKSAREK